MGTVIVVTSGKGGTGKTSLTGGLSVGLAELGHCVLCIDADIGLRNLDISLGMTDTVLMDFTDVMEGRCSLSRAVSPHPGIPNLSLLTAPLSFSREPVQKEDFKDLLSEARQSYDYILIDCPAGLGIGFQLATCDADEVIVVSMNDFSALRDAQRVVSQLPASISTIRLVVNRVQPKLLRRLGATIDDVMDTVGLPLLGIVPEDSQVILAANSGRALLQTNSKGAAKAYRNIAKRITGKQVPLIKIR
jgi:septum site-determining protein MinD